MEYLTFFIIAWLVLLIPGFDDSVPPTGDKTFKIEYSENVQSIKTTSDETLDFWGFDIELKQNSDDILDIKIPENFPTPASFTNAWHYDERGLVLVDKMEIAYEMVKDPCYFHYKIPVEGKKNVEIAYTVILTGKWQLYSPRQFDENDPCYNKVFYEQPILSPLKQFKSGVTSSEIKCKDDLQLITKSSNGHPACVKPESITKLVAWGWAKTREAAPITENDIMKNEVIRPEVRVVNGSADVAVNMSLTAIATNSTGSRLEYDITGLPTFEQDNDSIQLTLYHGTISGSNHVIAATIKNIGDRVVYVGSIDIEGMVPIPSGAAGFVSVLQAQAILSSIETTLQPDESLTAFIVGDWSVMGTPVTGFASQTTYSHQDPDANYRFGFSTRTPIQWIQ